MEITNDIIHVKESATHNFSLKLKSHSVGKTEFIMESSPAIINTIRRIIIDETPTIAPDTAVIYQNTSVMADEVLSQRLGLIPIAADPRLLDWPEDQISPANCLVFVLHVKAADQVVMVTSRDLQFSPLEGQLERFGDVRPLIESIPIVKLGPGQELKFEVYCHKGIGKVHAKWSPVSVCYFKALPIIRYQGAEATWESRALQMREAVPCPVGVFKDGEADLEKCTLCRACLDHGVQIFLDDSRYLFVIESVGFMNGIEVMEEALKVMQGKAQLVVDGL